jgi:hypothetical protein
MAILVKNPKDAAGSNKVPLHLWPQAATALGAMGLLEGMLKYGRSNWREGSVHATIYVDALKRHIDDWMEGGDVTSDVGLANLANALACLAIIVDAQTHGRLIDDRNYVPSGDGYRKLMARLTPEVSRLRVMFADRDVKHWTKLDNKPSKKRRPK